MAMMAPKMNRGLSGSIGAATPGAVQRDYWSIPKTQAPAMQGPDRFQMSGQGQGGADSFYNAQGIQRQSAMSAGRPQRMGAVMGIPSQKELNFRNGGPPQGNDPMTGVARRQGSVNAVDAARARGLSSSIPAKQSGFGGQSSNRTGPIPTVTNPQQPQLGGVQQVPQAVPHDPQRGGFGGPPQEGSRGGMAAAIQQGQNKKPEPGAFF